MYRPYNPNPLQKSAEDCTVRAISLLTRSTWNETYINLCAVGFKLKNMPASNEVWDWYLRALGFKRSFLPDTCPECYTLYDFTRDYPVGEYLVGTGSHVVAVIDGDYYDTSDSGGEVLLYYYERR